MASHGRGGHNNMINVHQHLSLAAERFRPLELLVCGDENTDHENSEGKQDPACNTSIVARFGIT